LIFKFISATSLDSKLNGCIQKHNRSLNSKNIGQSNARAHWALSERFRFWMHPLFRVLYRNFSYALIGCRIENFRNPDTFSPVSQSASPKKNHIDLIMRQLRAENRHVTFVE